MSPELARQSREKLKPFFEHLKEQMSPETYEFYRNWQRRQSSTVSSSSNDD